MHALKDGYINRDILKTLIFVVIQLVIGFSLCLQLFDSVTYRYIPVISPIFDSYFGSIPQIILVFWIFIGGLMLPLTNSLWNYVNRDKRLDNVSDDTRMNWELYKGIILRNRGCLAILLEVFKTVIVQQFLVITWLYWVHKTCSLFY